MTVTYTLPAVPQNGGTFDLDGSNTGWVRMTDTKFLIVYQQQSPAITYAQIMTINLVGAPTLGTAHQINQHNVTKSAPKVGYIKTGGVATDHKIVVAQCTSDVRFTRSELSSNWVFTILDVDEAADNIVSGNTFTGLENIKGTSLLFESNQNDTFYTISMANNIRVILHTVSGFGVTSTTITYSMSTTMVDEVPTRGEFVVDKTSDNMIHLLVNQVDDLTSSTKYSTYATINASDVGTSVYFGETTFGSEHARGLPVFGWSGVNSIDYPSNNRWRSQTVTFSIRGVPIDYPISQSRVPRELILVDTDTFLQLSMPVHQYTTSSPGKDLPWTSSMPMEVHIFHIDSGTNNTAVDNINNPISIGDVVGMAALSTNVIDSNRAIMWRNTSRMVYQMSPTQVMIMGLYDDLGTNKIGYKVLSI